MISPLVFSSMQPDLYSVLYQYFYHITRKDPNSSFLNWIFIFHPFLPFLFTALRLFICSLIPSMWCCILIILYCFYCFIHSYVCMYSSIHLVRWLFLLLLSLSSIYVIWAVLSIVFLSLEWLILSFYIFCSAHLFQLTLFHCWLFIL